jgi:ABC-2 type transport system permease protein
VVSRLVWPARAYLMLAWMWVRASMTYRASFALMTLVQFLITGLDFVGIVVMFASVDALGGFSLEEIAFLYAGSALCLGIADLLVGNIERLGLRVRMGTFDAMLVRPVPAFVQMCADEFALRRLGRIVQGLVVFVWAVAHLDIHWTAARIMLVLYLAVFGSAIFLAIFTIGAAVQFWTADASELAHSFTYGGSTLAQFPMTIYPREAVKALTFIVPITFINWYPSLYILGRDDPLGLPTAAQFASPVAAVAAAAVAALVWRVGIRRYRSTGS